MREMKAAASLALRERSLSSRGVIFALWQGFPRKQFGGGLFMQFNFQWGCS